MTSSQHNGRNRRAGFTLAEVLMAVGISSIILAGILTTFIALVRSGVRLENYSMMESQTRRAFEQMGIDVRMASDFTANFTGSNLTSFTLTIPSNDLSTTRTVTYGYDGSSGNYTFFYVPGSSATATTSRRNLITNVSSLTILRYDTNYTPLSGTTSTGIKHLQVSVNVSRSGVGVATATQVIRSSAFTIRNISL